MTDFDDIKVASVVNRGSSAMINFEDGHEAIFAGYAHGLGYAVESLRRFSLLYGDEIVVQYDARLHQVGPQEDEHRFVKVADGYTLERIAAFWEAASEYLRKEYLDAPGGGPDELWYPWMLTTTYGRMDLERIKEGRAPLPESTPS